MSKTLATIQTLSKIARIICKILFVFTIIGAICCLLSVFLFASMGDFIVEGIPFSQFFEESSGLTYSSLLAVMLFATVMCAFEAVTIKFAENYFTKELEEGTPFTFAGAKRLMTVGIVDIIAQVVAVVVSAILIAVLSASSPAFKDASYDFSVSLGGGIALIVVGLILKCATEQIENGKNNIGKTNQPIAKEVAEKPVENQVVEEELRADIIEQSSEEEIEVFEDEE